MFPIRDVVPSKSPPIATWMIIIACVVVYLVQVILPQDAWRQIVYLFGIVPRRFTHPEWATWVGFPADSYWPYVTSIFLHGGFLHVLMNMWMLWIFGDNVEDRMGKVRYVVFFMVCGIAAGIVHTITNPNSVVPTVGASGAIAGVLAAYLLLFPLARVICVIPILFIPLFVPVPAIVFIVLWLVLQFFGGFASLFEQGDVGGIAWWAHIGGFIVGFVLCPMLAAGQSHRDMDSDEYGVEGAWYR